MNRLGAEYGYPVKVDPDVVDVEAELKPYRYGYWPAPTAKTVELATVIPGWLRFGADYPVPLFVAEQRNDDGPLQTEVVQAVNAAETLHRALHPDSAEPPFTAKVKAALSAAGALNSDERRRVVNAVRLTELTLEERLLQLAYGLGHDFCGCFFDGQVKNWAHVAATIRNALSHGYQTKHKLEEDEGALVGALSLTRAVIQLRLLVNAGAAPADPFFRLIAKDQKYLALVKQRVEDWAKLANGSRS